MKKILVSTSTFGQFDALPVVSLEGLGQVIFNPFKRNMSEEEISKYIVDIDYLIAGTEPLTAKVLAVANKLKVISRCGTGLENVDLEAARQQNIIVFNTPDGSTEAVAELALGALLALLRQISLSDREIRQGRWNKRMGRLLMGKTLGVIGCGQIGQRVIELLAGFKLTLLAYDIRPACSSEFIREHNIQFVSKEELLKRADFVLIHVSGKAEIIGENELKLMKNNAFLLNLSRGTVVNETALYLALTSKQIAGAALDVFSVEPYRGNFIGLDNVVLTPHIGSYAIESRIKMENDAVTNLVRYINKGG